MSKEECDRHRLAWDRLEYVKVTDEYQDPDWITSSSCIFSRITREFSIVLTVLRSEFLSQPSKYTYKYS